MKIFQDEKKSSIPCLVVSLDKYEGRHEGFLNKNEQFFDEIIHVQAVDGRILPGYFTSSVFDKSYSIYALKHRGLRWLQGTLGCFLSHVKAMEILVASENDCAVLCEDDAKFVHAVNIDEISQYDLVFLNCRMSINKGEPFKKKILNGSSPQIVGVSNVHGELGTGMEAYFLTKKAARWILEMLRDIGYRGFPSGFDGFMQSYCYSRNYYANLASAEKYPKYTRSVKSISLDEGFSAKFCAASGMVPAKPGKKSIESWISMRDFDLNVGVLDYGLAIHDDNQCSIINS